MQVKPMGDWIMICFDEGEQGRIEIRKEGNNISVSHILEYADKELTPEQIDECRIFDMECNAVILKDEKSTIGWSGWHQDAQWTIER